MRKGFDVFDIAVTVLVFVDLCASAFLGQSHPEVLRWALLSLPLLYAAFWWGTRHLRVSRVIFDVLPEFKIHDNATVWRRVKHRYRYVGISGSSIIKELESYLDESRFPSGCKVEVLLMNPQSLSLLRESKQHELDRTPDESELIQLGRQVETAAGSFQALKVNGLQMEVRYYSEYLGYWAHLIDDGEVYLGPLFKGKSGLSTMVIMMKGGPENALVGHYRDQFERVWRNSSALAASR